MTSTPSIRLMQPSEVQLALNWADQEGWNPGLQDATAFYAADAKGFLVAELDREPIGCISAVRYSARFGFIGLYIVRSRWRGRGYGIRLWETAWQGLTNQLDQEGSSIGLDGVLEREAVYRQAGFKAAYRHIRHVHYPMPSDRVGWMWIAMNDAHDIPIKAMEQFQNRLISEDFVLLASYNHKRLPLNMQIEFHLPCDQGSLAYRKWLKQLGLSYGAITTSF